MEANYFTIVWWFLHTLTWISHGCTWVPHPEPPPTSLTSTSQIKSRELILFVFSLKTNMLWLKHCLMHCNTNTASYFYLCLAYGVCITLSWSGSVNLTTCVHRILISPSLAFSFLELPRIHLSLSLSLFSPFDYVFPTSVFFVVQLRKTVGYLQGIHLLQDQALLKIEFIKWENHLFH